ncbi:MAG: NAD(P)-dependent oxidoreductase [Opitutaceae bacterium]|nr:NAD(P)-dependent oxidoreductase [Opitutaceae bacterium]
MPSSLPVLPPLGLIGVGLLGSVLAERLLAGGLTVFGYDVDPARLAGLRGSGGEPAPDAAAVFRRCQRVIFSLPTHQEVSSLLHACASELRPGLIIIDTTTGDPAAAEALAPALALQGVVYLDATVSGSSAQVRDGAAILMVGGDAPAFARCADIFSLVAARCFHTGGPGSGARMKLVTNLVLGLNRAALAEGLALARGLGVDAAQALALMRAGPAYSRIMDAKGGKMLTGNFAPEARLSQHLKDVRLILQHGLEAGLPMPLSIAHRAVLEAAEAAGLGALDNSAIIQVLQAAPPGAKEA